MGGRWLVTSHPLADVELSRVPRGSEWQSTGHRKGERSAHAPPLPPPHCDPSSHNLRRVVYHLEQTTGEGGGRLGTMLPGAQGAGVGENGDRLPQDAVPCAVTVRAHGVGAEARVAQRRLPEYNRGR